MCVGRLKLNKLIQYIIMQNVCESYELKHILPVTSFFTKIHMRMRVNYVSMRIFLTHLNKF